MRKLCECGAVVHARGLCHKHYERARSNLPGAEWRPTDVFHAKCGGTLWQRLYEGRILQFCAECRQRGYPAASSVISSNLRAKERTHGGSDDHDVEEVVGSVQVLQQD